MAWVYRQRFYILFALYIGTLLLFWPGYLNPDSLTQYNQAVLRQFGDHHPPMMSYLWHYLDRIYPGVGMMFVWQLSCLYLGIVILLLTLDKLTPQKKQHFLCIPLLILPIYPQVLIYAITVVKDVQYTFCFLLSAAILAFYTVQGKSHHKLTFNKNMSNKICQRDL